MPHESYVLQCVSQNLSRLKKNNLLCRAAKIEVVQEKTISLRFLAAQMFTKFSYFAKSNFYVCSLHNPW